MKTDNSSTEYEIDLSGTDIKKIPFKYIKFGMVFSQDETIEPLEISAEMLQLILHNEFNLLSKEEYSIFDSARYADGGFGISLDHELVLDEAFKITKDLLNKHFR